ncbi:hypothetical protein PHA8399_01993 [Leisingera aquaemixtae]|uniref:Uncharacterized protein n=1 Tax=Leisingera aquaemixtae TaxID=1396826 RepID=A0A0P1H9G6_9RHOB|nr:hypothetical protein PHA8399_01993 [Leisingera aquaemixtae]
MTRLGWLLLEDSSRRAARESGGREKRLRPAWLMPGGVSCTGTAGGQGLRQRFGRVRTIGRLSALPRLRRIARASSRVWP